MSARAIAAALLSISLLGGCGLPRHLATRPDHDLPGGFSSTYRRALVLEGAVTPAPSDADLMGHFADGPGPGEVPPVPPPLRP